MFGAPEICKNYSSSSGRSAADSNQTLQLHGPELSPLTWPPIIPPGTRSPRHPRLGLPMVQRCFGGAGVQAGGIRMCRSRGRSWGWRGGDTGLRQRHFSSHRAPGQWKMRPVAGSACFPSSWPLQPSLLSVLLSSLLSLFFPHPP